MAPPPPLFQSSQFFPCKFSPFPLMGFSKDSAHNNTDIRKIFKRGLGSYSPLHAHFDHGLTSVIPGFTLSSSVTTVHAHPLPIFLGCALLFFMKLEYTMDMVMPGMEPRDLGFQFTAWLHHLLANHPLVNSIFAGCNTGFVVFQVTYVIWTFLVDRRKRPAIASLFMYTFRAFLGYSTQLPVPQDFLGSGLDFPVNNTSFFLFFSGHVAGSVIISMDMRRMQHNRLGCVVDILNVLQSLRLLATRGHYTIDLAIGAAAGCICDLLAGKYEEIHHKVSHSLKCNNATNGGKI